MTGREKDEIAILVKVPKLHFDMALKLNQELKLGHPSIQSIIQAAVREYALTWIRRWFPTVSTRKEYEVLQRCAAKGGLTVEQLLLELYSLPDAELRRLLPLGFKKK